MNKNEMADFISGCELFQGLNKREAKKIAGLAHLESYKAGESIFSQGDTGDNLAIIIEGSVYLERSIDLGGRKGKALICVIGRGRALGCWSTLLGKKHKLMASANCRKPTKVLVFKGNDLNKLMLNNTDVGFKISQALCSLLISRIEGAYGAMENL